MNEKSVEYLIPGREDAAGCLTDNSRAENNTNDMFVKRTAFLAYSYPSVVAAVADSTYIELENSLGGTSSVLDVAAQPGKYQHKMMYRMLMTAGGGVLAAIIVLGVVVRRKSKREDV